MMGAPKTTRTVYPESALRVCMRLRKPCPHLFSSSLSNLRKVDLNSGERKDKLRLAGLACILSQETRLEGFHSRGSMRMHQGKNRCHLSEVGDKHQKGSYPATP